MRCFSSRCFIKRPTRRRDNHQAWCVSAAACRSSGGSLGSRTVNTEPFPGSLVTVTSPPIMRASLRERARPSPVPLGSHGKPHRTTEILSDARRRCCLAARGACAAAGALVDRMKDSAPYETWRDRDVNIRTGGAWGYRRRHRCRQIGFVSVEKGALEVIRRSVSPFMRRPRTTRTAP
jgi:hypothetical protein